MDHSSKTKKLREKYNGMVQCDCKELVNGNFDDCTNGMVQCDCKELVNGNFDDCTKKVSMAHLQPEENIESEEGC